MNISFQLAYWMIPAVITIGSIVWALFIVKPEQGVLGGLNNILMLIPALAISCVAWIVYAVFA